MLPPANGGSRFRGNDPRDWVRSPLALSTRFFGLFRPFSGVDGTQRDREFPFEAVVVDEPLDGGAEGTADHVFEHRGAEPLAFTGLGEGAGVLAPVEIEGIGLARPGRAEAAAVLLEGAVFHGVGGELVRRHA